MNSLELLRRRLEFRGGNQEGRIKKEKAKSLLGALKYSEQAETVIKKGEIERRRVILNKNKQKMDYDDKNISAPFECNFKVGDIFHWVEDDSDWLIYLKEGQDAYFTGLCRKAAHKIRWEDEFGVVHSESVSVRGPVETKVRSQIKSDLSFDEPNYTLYVLAPATDDTRTIKRYSKVSIGGQMWEATVVDSISEPGVLEIQLVESYINRSKDSNLIKDGEVCEFIPSENVKIVSSLDVLNTVEIDEPYKLWTRIEKDGEPQEKLLENLNYKIISGSASIEGDILTALSDETIKIRLNIPKLCYAKEYDINATSEEIPVISNHEIHGDSKVRSFGSSKYEIKYFIDGIEAEGQEGQWVLSDDSSLFTIEKINSKELILKWSIGSHGKIKLQYTINNSVVAAKEIKIESLI